MLFGTAAGLFVTAAAPATAGGFYLKEQSVRGLGRANSGEVADQGPASLWWNPAAIAGTREKEAAFGATAILPRGRVSDDGTLIDRPGAPPQPVGGLPSRSNPILGGVAPNNAFALPLSKRI
ncbi:MAG TPA: outer membrane protein transport protein, partial [Allosphingosinicella sp.]